MKLIEDAELLIPRSLSEALAWQADPATRGLPLAGGTDLMVQWEAAARAVPERVLDVKSLPELRGLCEGGGCILIGASVTHAELRRSPLVQRGLPALAAAAATVGGTQIQALGTIAGNVANASPAGDLAPALLIAEGDVVVASVRGERRVPVRKFWIGYRRIDLQPDELIVRFELPAIPAGAREAFHKLGPRAAQAISKVMAAHRTRLEDGRIADIRIALGSVGPTAVRLDAVESWLRGRALDASTLEEAEARVAAAIEPIDDIRSTADYRRWVSGRLVRGFLGAL
jgi:xanthine dehydrogenase FAD-binding subunit